MNVKNGLLTLAAISTFGLVVDQNQIQVHADGVPRVTGGQAGLPRMDVVDVSSNNGYLSTNDFQIMKNNGVRGIIVKLTEGTYYRNPYASSQVNNARAVGLKVSAYHYSTFNNQNSARSEANFFADYASQLGFNSSDLMVNDLEDSSTTGGDVSGNSWAFNDQLKNRGFTNGALYTYTSYKNNNGLNTWFLANDHIWMAAYPYYPSINSLWNSQYGMWQWSSNAGFGGISGTFDVSIDYSGIASQLLNGYVYDGSQGHDGYRWYDNGQLGNGKRWYAGTYYWFSNGERIDNSWQSDATGTYYTGADGRSYQGLQTIGNAQYYFGSDFTLQKSQYVTVNGWQYYVNAQGIAMPLGTGYLYTGASGHDGYRWFDNGQIGSGKRWYAGTYYWFDQNGERIDNSWQSDATGTYYTGADGRSYQGLQTIGNAQYYFGSDFTLQKNQYVTVNGRQYYVNAQGIARSADTGYIYTGASGHDGYRWFDNGQIGSGKRWYAGTYYWFDQNGERIDNSWQSDATGTYYTGADGRSYQGLQTIGNAQYYFGSDFTLQKNQYVTVNGRQYYVNAQGIARSADTGYIYTGASGHDGYRWFDNGQIGSGKRWYAGTYYWFDQNGERIDNSWQSDATGTYYTGADGRSYQGLQTIGNAQYYFGSDFTLQKNQYVTVNGRQYYVNAQGIAKSADTGYIYTGASGHDGYRWFDNGQIGSGKRWYAGTYYWFDQNGERIDNSWQSDATGTYYTGADGRSYQGLQTIGNAQYYFGSDFTLQKNQYVTVNGRQYYVNAQGIARSADTGYIYTGASGHDGYRWFDNGQIGSGKRWYAGTYYWFDQNGERIDNSWQSDATGTYYTGADGRSYQGLQTIGNAQYYFGSDFTLQKNQYVTVNGRQYYVNAQGIARSADTGYIYTGASGHDGYRWFDNGQIGSGKRWYAGTYYWFDQNGERIDNSWQSDATGTYYTGADGRSYQGLQTIGNAQYYFGSDFTLQKNQYVTVNGQQYYLDDQGKAKAV